MFTNASCTVWEKAVQNRAVTYIRHTVGAVYWEDTRGETVNGIARDPDDRALMIVHADLLGGYLPKPDDRILRGNIADEQPPNTALTVTSVKDFRYGSAAVQHIEITAK